MPVKSARKPDQKRAAPRRSPASGRILTTHVGQFGSGRAALCENFWPPNATDGRTTKQPSEHACMTASPRLVRKQAEIGLNIVNDGEYGKTIRWLVALSVLQRLRRFRAARATRGRHAGGRSHGRTAANSRKFPPPPIPKPHPGSQRE